MSLWTRLVGRKSAPSIPMTWPIDWYQRGYSPPVPVGSGPVVEACVSAYATSIAQLPAQVIRTLPDGTKQRIMTGRVADVLRTPNDYQTTSDVLLNLTYGLLLNGNSYIVGLGDTSRTPDSVHLLDPRITRAERVAETGDVFYSTSGAFFDMLDADNERALIPSRFVAHFRLHTPNDPLIGVTPITAATASVAANSSILSSSAAFYANMSRPSGFLSSELELNATQMSQLREAWNKQSQDLNTGGVPILGSGMKWNPLSITSQDAQLVEAWKMSVEDIARGFRVPPPLIGVLENASFSNVSELMQFWLRTGLGFTINHVESTLTRFFDLPADQRIELDTSVLLRMDEKSQMESLGIGVTKGLLAPNEARKRLGYGPVDGGDQPFVQVQNVPLSVAVTANAAPPKADPDDDDGEKVYLSLVERIEANAS